MWQSPPLLLATSLGGCEATWGGSTVPASKHLVWWPWALRPRWESAPTGSGTPRPCSHGSQLPLGPSLGGRQRPFTSALPAVSCLPAGARLSVPGHRGRASGHSSPGPGLATHLHGPFRVQFVSATFQSYLGHRFFSGAAHRPAPHEAPRPIALARPCSLGAAGRPPLLEERLS